MRLAVVGDVFAVASEYIQQMWRSADPRVVFPVHVFGRGYWKLQRHAYLFCAPTEVGGNHPVIVQAMAAGNCVLVTTTPRTRRPRRCRSYLAGRAGVQDRATQLARLLDPPQLVSSFRALAFTRARHYSWAAITDQYERTLTAVREASRPRPLPASMVDVEESPLPEL
jgi:glycosyltransferase involved in cell wall biosynthesis